MKNKINNLFIIGIPTAFLLHLHILISLYILKTFFKIHLGPLFLFPMGAFDLTVLLNNTLPRWLSVLCDISPYLCVTGYLYAMEKPRASFKCCICSFLLIPVFLADIVALIYLCTNGYKENLSCQMPMLIIIIELLLVISQTMRIAAVRKLKKNSSDGSLS